MPTDDLLQRTLAELGLGNAYRQDGGWIDEFYRLGSQLEERVEEKRVLHYRFNPESGMIRIVPIFDVHVGMKACDEEMLERHIEYIERTPDTYTFLGGDLMESATRDSVGMGIFDERYHLADQIARIRRLLKPLAEKNKILGAITGNHEMRTAKYNTADPLADICDVLNIPFLGYQAFIKITVNGITYKTIWWHGASGATTKGGKMNAVLRMRKLGVADLYTMGHVHDRFYTEEIEHDMDDETDELVAHKRIYLIAGSFLRYFGGYSEMKGFAPASLGAPMILLNGQYKDIRILL